MNFRRSGPGNEEGQGGGAPKEGKVIALASFLLLVLHLPVTPSSAYTAIKQNSFAPVKKGVSYPSHIPTI